MITKIATLILLLAVALIGRAAEEQSHGVVFEKWVRDTFFNGYKPESYTQKWDIPAKQNVEHGGIPANPKATKFGTPIDMGDALRQFAVAQGQDSFIIISGFWDQDGDYKKWVLGMAVTVTVEQYRKLWGPVTQADLAKLDAVIKDKSLSVEDARAAAQKIKNAEPFTKAIIQVNPKLDSKQRRLQCSIRFADFFKALVPDMIPARQEKPEIWGKAMPAPMLSPPRRR
jgi:hypothetical protein